jgi:murein DD-endopeptidase MepM/ murein hydrolase activator NlpD
MKKLYYFSKSKLQFVEIKHYKIKLSLYLGVGILSLFALIFATYSFALSLFGVDTYSSLGKENELLKQKLDKVFSNYKSLNSELDSLIKTNNDLRIATDLEPVSPDEQLVGIGGGSFDNNLDFLTDDSQLKLQQAFDFMDEVSRKVEFEKRQYIEVSNKLKENERLFESIPAIKPCIGTLAAHGFGMRLHPILNIRRKHEGIDIITDRGTSVYAAGKGRVDYVGYKGGLGLAVEIDHGFGYRTIYAHLSKALVKRGQKIIRGDLIAKTGSSGLSSGPHLHYEVQHNGLKQNPLEFFFDDLNFFEVSKRKK